MRSLLLVCFAACGFESGVIVNGDAANDGDAGTDGQITPGDSDGDSFKDDVDNCPTVSNANQRNHDGDPRGDACDTCPGLPSPTDPDSDGDGVGDACDPRPADPGESAVLFEGFYDDASTALWTSAGGTWDVVNGRLEQSDEAADYAFTRPPLPGGPLTRHAIMASVRIDVIGQPGDDYKPSVAVGGGITAETGYFCLLRENDDPEVRVYGTYRDGDSIMNPSDSDPWTGTFAAGSEATLFGRIVGPDNICTASQATTSIMVEDDHGPTTGIVEVATSRMAASFDYVFVVSVGS